MSESSESFSLVTWFRERRTSKIVEKFNEHVSKVIDTCNEFHLAMIALTREESFVESNEPGYAIDDVGEKDDESLQMDKFDEAEAAFKRVLIQERAADLIKQQLFKDISRIKLDSKVREDLFKLIYQIDPIANWIKVAAKNALILLDLHLEIPEDIWARFRTISEMVLSSARLLRKMIQVLGIDDKTLLDIRVEIETLEQSVDDIYFIVKKSILSENLAPQAMITAMDLLSGLENASDHAAGSADILYILVMASR